MSDLSLARYKVCSGCGCTKPSTTEFFHSNGKGPGKLYPLCRPCRTLYRGFTTRIHLRVLTREWLRQKYVEERLNIEEIARLSGCARPTVGKRLAEVGIARTKAGRGSHRRPAVSEKQCRGCEETKALTEFYDPTLNYCKRCASSRVSRYQAMHPEKRREWSQARYAKSREAGPRVESGVIWQMYEDQGGMCAYCETPLFGNFHVDHIVPLVRGGSNAWSNLAIACPSCNCSKGDKSVEEFISWRSPVWGSYQ